MRDAGDNIHFQVQNGVKRSANENLESWLLYGFVVDSTGKYKFEFVVDRDGHGMFPHERSRICICRAFYLRKLA